MKKNELKNSMIVELRNGDKRLVVDNNILGNNGFDNLLNYKDDLKNKVNSKLDITKVYKYKFARSFYSLLDYDNLNLIWERDEIKLTDKEIEILKALKVLGYIWLSRDENTRLYAYSEKAYKDGDGWLTNGGEYVSVNSIITLNFIEWEDEEPTNIDQLLKEIKK